MPKKSTKLKVWKMENRRPFVSLIGFFLGVFGILCGMFWQQIFNQILSKEMTLRPNSKVYDKWKNPPLELYLDIYLFNWTNPEDIRNTSTKPIMKELGPYRFREIPDKVNITWHPDNHTVTYMRKSDFYFDEAGSKGSLSDNITTINPIAISAAATTKHWNPMRQSMIDVGLKLYGQEISVTKTADELLFTGYSDAMIDVARAMPMFGDDVQVPFDKFGWFYTRNGSADLTGIFNIFTGADDIRKLGQMNSWNYRTHSGFFADGCGMNKGSAGEFQPSNLQVGGSVELFTPDMCRTVPLDYVETVDFEGLNAYKYAGGPRSVDNGTLFEENKCFCGGECVPSGVMNISSCRFGSPVFMSYPHFYNADPFYVQQVEGMTPNSKDHEFYMVLEPNTGIPLEVAARFQVNMLMESVGAISLYENIPRVFLPLIWFEQKVRMTPELAAELKMLPRVLMGGQIFAGICFAVGLILLLWYPFQSMWGRKRVYDTDTTTKKSQQSLNQQQNSMMPLENGKYKKPVFSEKELKTPDGSPLLEKPIRHPKQGLLPKEETFDSVKTNTSTFSVRSKE